MAIGRESGVRVFVYKRCFVVRPTGRPLKTAGEEMRYRDESQAARGLKPGPEELPGAGLRVYHCHYYCPQGRCRPGMNWLADQRIACQNSQCWRPSRQQWGRLSRQRQPPAEAVPLDY
jgi:hypothetical protein